MFSIDDEWGVSLKKDPLHFSLVIILFLLIGSALVVGGYRDADYWQGVKSMPTTDGYVTDLFYEYDHDTWLWGITILNNYSVNCTNYSGMQTLEYGGIHYHENGAQKTTLGFYPGREMTIRYDPQNPEVSRLMYRESDGSIIIISVGYCVLLATPFVGAFYFRERVLHWIDDE